MFLVVLGLLLRGTNSEHSPHSILTTAFSSEPHLCVSNQQKFSSLGPRPGRLEEATEAKDKTKFVIHLGQIISWLWRRFSHPCPPRTKVAQNNQNIGERMQLFSNPIKVKQSNYLSRTTQEDAPWHCSLDVSNRTEQCLGDFGGHREFTTRIGQVSQP